MAGSRRKYTVSEGDRFGDLTVIREFRDRFWFAECKCDCGNITTVRLDNLGSGHSNSCGHARPRLEPLPIKPGDMFGQLEILRVLSGMRREADCRCSCGKELTVRVDNLHAGLQVSCGCGKGDPVAAVLPAIEAVIAREGRTVSAGRIAEELTEAGARAEKRRVAKLVAQAGLKAVTPGVPDGPEPAVLESLRWDGLITTTQLADGYGVGVQAIWDAVKAGELTVRLREKGGRMLFDPARVTDRKSGLPAPVDAGHPLARQPSSR